jgi:nucleoside-diphosphate-sugar epimerase
MRKTDSIGSGISVDGGFACNVTGSRNILRYALSAGAAKLIYASTMSTDRRRRSNGNDANYCPDVYGASKFLAERIFAEASEHASSSRELLHESHSQQLSNSKVPRSRIPS